MRHPYNPLSIVTRAREGAASLLEDFVDEAWLDGSMLQKPAVLLTIGIVLTLLVAICIMLCWPRRSSSGRDLSSGTKKSIPAASSAKAGGGSAKASDGSADSLKRAEAGSARASDGSAHSFRSAKAGGGSAHSLKRADDVSAKADGGSTHSFQTADGGSTKAGGDGSSSGLTLADDNSTRGGLISEGPHPARPKAQSRVKANAGHTYGSALFKHHGSGGTA